jgi:hypothetical protein
MQSLQSPKDISRFWSKVAVASPDSCWEWQAGTVDGYGIFQVGPSLKRAHRVSYAIQNGSAPDDLVLRHKCDNRRCVNPGHLLPGTKKQNMEDAVARGRHAHGERHGRSKLTAEKVLEMRSRFAAGEKVASIARAFGVCGLVAKKAITGISWKHVPHPTPTPEAA